MQYVEEAWFPDRRLVKYLKDHFCHALEFSNKLDTLLLGDKIQRLLTESLASCNNYKCTEFTMEQFKTIYSAII